MSYYFSETSQTSILTISLPFATFLALYPFDRPIVENEIKVFTTSISIFTSLLGLVIDTSEISISNKRSMAFTALSIAAISSIKQLYDNNRISLPSFSFGLKIFGTSISFSMRNKDESLLHKQN